MSFKQLGISLSSVHVFPTRLIVVNPRASFEYAVTWIMSQRILIHPRGT